MSRLREEASGGTIGWRIRCAATELKYALQRARRGYDDCMVFDFSQEGLRLFVRSLEALKKIHHGLFVDPDTLQVLTEKETTQVFDKLIAAANAYMTTDLFSSEDEAVLDKRRRAFFHLLERYYDQLRD